jgi:hypothetical protein
MKWLLGIVLVIGLIILGGYSLMRNSLKPAIIKPQPTKESTPVVKHLDLVPLLKAKIQQLVHEGSHGLYDLQLENVSADILQSKLTLFEAALVPNKKIYSQLEEERKAPDDLFHINFHSLYINGIDLKDILSNKDIDIEQITLDHPDVEVYNTPHPYNEKERKSETLYQKLKKLLTHFSVRSVIIKNASIFSYSGKADKQLARLTNVNVNMGDVLIDSSTQYDKSRFLFAKKAILSFNNYGFESNDRLYKYEIVSAKLDAVKHNLTAHNFRITPKYSKQEWSKVNRYMKELYNFNISTVNCTGVNWWELVNRQKIEAEKLIFDNPVVYSYLDRSLPEPPNAPVHNFPDQLLLRMPLKVNVREWVIHNGSITYEEYHEKVQRSAKIYFDQVNGIARNVTNLPESIKRNSVTSFSGTARFMSTTPTNATFKFNLNDVANGSFSADLSMGKLDASTINSFSTTMSTFILKRGEMKQASGHVEGNNYSAKGHLLLLYDDLHITPVKDTLNTEGKQKKKHLTSFIANTFLIKNSNPSNGSAPRQEDGNFQRKPNTSFFNLVFKTMLTATLKTIGLPVKLADK